MFTNRYCHLFNFILMNYYIQGNKDKAEQIMAAFKKLGFTWEIPNCVFSNENLFLLTRDGIVESHYINKTLFNIIKTHPDYKELELPVKPNFKVGDNVKTGNQIDTIAEVGYETRSYYCESGRTISFENQDLWELDTKPHYDISQFKPFQKVLTRDTENGTWMANLFSNEDARTKARFRCVNSIWIQCIPFEGNEHLLGTSDMPSEEYINW